MSEPPPLTITMPERRRNGPSGPWNSSSLASTVDLRRSIGPSQPATSGGSRLLAWFATTMSGPEASPWSLGTCARGPRRAHDPASAASTSSREPKTRNRCHARPVALGAHPPAASAARTSATTWLTVWSRLCPSVRMVTASSGHHERRRRPGAVDGVPSRELVADLALFGAAGLESPLGWRAAAPAPRGRPGGTA